MDDQPVPDAVKPVKSQRVQHREARLKVALKANMARRKAQVRGRAETDSAETDQAETDWPETEVAGTDRAAGIEASDNNQET